MNDLIDAWNEYKKAKHLLKVTYPMTNDPKVLLGVVENIRNSMSLIIKQDMSLDAAKTWQEVKEITAAYKKSPMAFRRRGKFVICSHDYLLKEVSESSVKGYLAENYRLLHKVLGLDDRN